MKLSMNITHKHKMKGGAEKKLVNIDDAETVDQCCLLSLNLGGLTCVNIITRNINELETGVGGSMDRERSSTTIATYNKGVCIYVCRKSFAKLSYLNCSCVTSIGLSCLWNFSLQAGV